MSVLDDFARISKSAELFKKLWDGINSCKECGRDPRTMLALKLQNTEDAFKNCLCPKHRKMYEDWSNAYEGEVNEHRST